MVSSSGCAKMATRVPGADELELTPPPDAQAIESPASSIAASAARRVARARSRASSIHAIPHLLTGIEDRRRERRRGRNDTRRTRGGNAMVRPVRQAHLTCDHLVTYLPTMTDD